ncbi:unnamed protein product [Umbelopsis ramanniana]
MSYESKLPSEILTIVFQHLCRQDLVSCSRTCWTWNASANLLLYKTVSISNHAMFQQFNESIADFQDHNKTCVEGTNKRRQQLGELVQAVDIRIDHFLHEIHKYFPRLSRLASGTPNVHTSKLFPPSDLLETDSNPPFDWGILASHWPKLTSLTLSRRFFYDEEENVVLNMNDIFDRLQHVDISNCQLPLNYMLPSPPNMPHLETFAVMISDPGDYHVLRTILQTCQSTLRTLIIILYNIYGSNLVDLEPGSIDLDHLIMGQKQLKAFGMTTYNDSPISITSFGDNLEHLEWRSLRTKEVINSNQSINEAMIKTKNLKTLSLAGIMSDHHVSLTLKSNKSTLHTFFYHSSSASGLISVLLMNKVQLDNVTTLCFDCNDFENSDVRSLAQIFPSVEFLAVCRARPAHNKPPPPPPPPRRLGSSQRTQREQKVEIDVKWIETGALSQFRHLKAIDRITFLELLDPSSVTFQQCDILPSKSWLTPRAIPMSL